VNDDFQSREEIYFHPVKPQMFSLCHMQNLGFEFSEYPDMTFNWRIGFSFVIGLKTELSHGFWIRLNVTLHWSKRITKSKYINQIIKIQTLHNRLYEISLSKEEIREYYQSPIKEISDIALLCTLIAQRNYWDSRRRSYN